MLFAAGLGTRLKPITNNKPKALVELNGKPLIWYAIQYLQNAGVNRIVVNIHHFAEQVKKYCENAKFKAEIIFSNESEKLLDTGGGIKKADSLFSKKNDIIVFNTDIITDISIKKLLNIHKKNKNLSTLSVSNRQGNRKLLFDKENKLTGWRNIQTQEYIKTSRFEETHYEASFSGLHIISPQIFELMPKDDVFSIIQLYLKLSDKHRIEAFIQKNNYWFDIGTAERLKIATEKLKNKF